MSAKAMDLFHERQAVAQTILNQLGSGRFLAMTGAKYLSSVQNAKGEYGLSMKLPKGFAKNKIECVRIFLSSADLYDFEAYTVSKQGHWQPIAPAPSGIYAEQLGAAFKELTGLDTKL